MRYAEPDEARILKLEFNDKKAIIRSLDNNFYICSLINEHKTA